MQPQKRIVVLGAGFGGVYAIRRLHRRFHGDPSVRMTLVSRENYFLFTPLLHEVATGGLTPGTIVEPLRQVLGCGDTELRYEDVRRVRIIDKVVETSSGEIPFDVLLIALGAETNFYNVSGAEQYARTLKSLPDAIDFKRKIIAAFESASRTTDEHQRERLLHFVIVGGGATGVELAAELQEFAAGSLFPAYRRALGSTRPTVVLLQQAGELLLPFSPAIRKKALSVLCKKGVNVRLRTAVTAVDADGVLLGSGERIDASVVVWVAGVRPSPLVFDVAVAREKNGRIITDAAFRVGGREDIFAIGDIAAVPAFTGTGTLPQFAQVAVAEARHAADNLRRAALGESSRPFVYHHVGHLVSLGQWMAAAEIGPFRFWGHFAWWLWRTIYLTKFISTRKKFSIALQWTINLFSSRDIAQM